MNRMSRTVGLAAAGGLALGVLVPTAASATSIEGYSGDVAAAAISTITEDRGVSDAAAARILRVQQDSARTLSELTTRLGDQQVGGYLDARGLPVVNVVSEAAAEQVRAEGATARFVSRSTARLDAARAALEAVPPVAHTSIGLDPRANQVVVTVSEAAADAAASVLLATADRFGDAVRVERFAGEMHKAIYNGEAITGGGSRCSAGFNVNRGGQNYIVDAGHCTGAVAQWNVGPSVEASFPGDDYGLIRNDTGSAPGEVTLWDGTTQAITSAADATVGQQICKSGSTTNLTCGTVEAVDVTVNYAEGAVHELVQTSAAVNSGDSGGCLFAGSVGLGITSGMGGGNSYFQPVTEALSAYGVSLN
ncbi:S1 family peptidase [Prauserella muralis]|uniref:Trypsin n=1 Tax=Prauserella muralis TaxID=588067 RepID=A0A2V4BA31_9PSEU|nr:S1 family peptidase [Prauserella muralis]PXY32147.1 trypsin [Prauserella muralis]TWE24199.1 streptogrisin D [Prauserella muralis]